MTTALPKPSVLLFDVNETLLDLSPVKASVGQALGGREDLLPLWFSTMLHYSLVETLCESYQDFGEIGSAALKMVAETQGLSMSLDEAREAILPAMASLPPHPDVVPALEQLSQRSYRLVSLTNSSTKGVARQFEHAGITHHFERRFSVEGVGKYKPHPATYRMALEELAVEAQEVLMIAAHPWDLMGAKAVGLQTAFLARPGKPHYPIASDADYVANDLEELASQLPT